MESSPPFSDAGLAQIVEEYRLTGNIGTLIDRVRALAAQTRPEQLARAALADNAASLASAQDDPAALDLAIQTYQGLLDESARPEQRLALEGTLKALKTR